jgi:hypothetical protein
MDPRKIVRSAERCEWRHGDVYEFREALSGREAVAVMLCASYIARQHVSVFNLATEAVSRSYTGIRGSRYGLRPFSLPRVKVTAES